MSNIASFLLEVTHKELDHGFISVHFQWSSRLLKPAAFKYIPKGTSEIYKTIQNLFLSAWGIPTPES